MISQPSGPGLDVSAIVATLGRPAELEACLRSLAGASPGVREVIVVDQSAKQAQRALVESLGGRYVWNEARGLSRARNQGIKEATGEWLFFPDDDCTVAPDALAKAAEALARLPGAAFLCGRVVPPDATAEPGDVEQARVLADPHAVLRVGMSAGLFVRRALVDRIHGFDDRFGVGSRYPSGEESDLLFRLLAERERGLYEPRVRIHHPDPFAIRDAEAAMRRAFEYGRGWGALFAKHAAFPGGKTYVRLYRHYLMRALGGVALSALRLNPDLLHRYLASFYGRRLGWKQFYLQERLS